MKLKKNRKFGPLFALCNDCIFDDGIVVVISSGVEKFSFALPFATLKNTWGISWNIEKFGQNDLENRNILTSEPRQKSEKNYKLHNGLN